MSARGTCTIKLHSADEARELAAAIGESGHLELDPKSGYAIEIPDVNSPDVREWAAAAPKIMWVAFTNDECEDNNSVYVHTGFKRIVSGRHVDGDVVTRCYGQEEQTELVDALNTVDILRTAPSAAAHMAAAHSVPHVPESSQRSDRKAGQPVKQSNREVLKAAGVKYPEATFWNEMSSSGKDLWEERQLNALRKRQERQRRDRAEGSSAGQANPTLGM